MTNKKPRDGATSPNVAESEVSARSQAVWLEEHKEERAKPLPDEPISLAIAENDRLRSRYVRHLIREADSRTKGTAAVPPRVLVQFWDDAKAVPADVRECMDSWRPLDEKGFERLLFDDISAGQFIEGNFGRRHSTAFGRCGHPAMRSDYFRLCFIMKMGGFYVDADDVYHGGDFEAYFRDDRLKLQPLCYAISSDSMVDAADFLTDPLDVPDLIYYFNNNPLIAPLGHPVIRLALERSTKLLLSQADGSRDPQSTTGPGNLTASLVQHAIESEGTNEAPDFVILADWDTVAVSRWPLQYRNDERNWRRWVSRNA